LIQLEDVLPAIEYKNKNDSLIPISTLESLIEGFRLTFCLDKLHWLSEDGIRKLVIKLCREQGIRIPKIFWYRAVWNGDVYETAACRLRSNELYIPMDMGWVRHPMVIIHEMAHLLGQYHDHSVKFLLLWADLCREYCSDIISRSVSHTLAKVLNTYKYAECLP